MKLLKDIDGGVTVVEAGLYDVCEWWIETYPDDIFVNNPKEVIQIRELMKKVLEKRASPQSGSEHMARKR